MKEYVANIIFGGNIRIPIKAKDEDSAYDKTQKIKREDFVKLFKKYGGQLIDFEATVIEDEKGNEIEI